MNFTKMEGTGNDYVYVNCLQETLEDPSKVARIVSDRHFGVGSDGLILIRPSKQADFYMEMYNADGSEGKMCGNGIRCVAKYVYDYGLTDKTDLSVETLSGVKHLRLNIKDGKVDTVRVNMGRPILNPQDIPVAISGDDCIAQSILAGEREYQMTCVSMGNPHAVVFMDDLELLEIEKIGPKFERHQMFPQGVNTEFVEVIDRGLIRMRVWERGSGETLACGTGACAAAVAGVLNGYTDQKVTVQLLGGNLLIEWDKEADKVYMTGPAKTVFDGEIVIA